MSSCAVCATGGAASGVTGSWLRHDLARGAAAPWLSPARARATPGSYALLALAGADRTWCCHAHNVAATSLVLVTEREPGRPAAASPPPMPQPQPPITADPHGIEVHGTALVDVVAVLEGAGGTILDVAPDVWAGPQWLSTHFVVRRS